MSKPDVSRKWHPRSDLREDVEESLFTHQQRKAIRAKRGKPKPRRASKKGGK